MLYKYCPKCGTRYKQEEIKNFLKYKKRLSCEKCSCVFYNNPKPTVGALIKNKKSQILFTKRAIKPYCGWWDLPGGFLDYGESPEQALIREIKEELNAEIAIKKPLGAFKEFYQNKGNKDEKYSLITIIYLAELKGNNMQAGDDVAEYKFFSLDSLPKKIAFPGLRKFMKNLDKL